MKKPITNIILVFLIIGLILLYIINPLNKEIELNGWFSLVLLALVLLKVVSKNKIAHVIIRLLGACFYLYLLIFYFK
jgi:hypothetical protein